MKTSNIIQKLVRIPSITPDGEKAIEFISSLLREIGFSIFPCNKEDVFNIVALYDNDPTLSYNKSLGYLGHCDVVDPGPIHLWKHNPFEGVIENGFLWGRGVCDMKGSIGCFIVATHTFLQKYPEFKGRIVLLITSDEEGAAIHGTRHIVSYLKKKNIPLSHCIIGEPTSTKIIGDSIKIGRRGSLNIKITIRGKQGHVGYASSIINPVHEAYKVIDFLCNWNIDAPSNFFEKSSLQITGCYTSDNPENVSPYEMFIKLNIRFGKQSKGINLIETIQRKIKTLLSKDVSFEIQVCSLSDPFITSSEDIANLISDSIFDICSIRPQKNTRGGTSDGRFIQDICPFVEIGLQSGTIHQVNERSTLEDIETLYRIYYQALCRYFIQE